MEFLIGKISKVNYEEGCADVIIEEKEEMIISDIQILKMEENKELSVNDVVSLFYDNILARGIILGKFAGDD